MQTSLMQDTITPSAISGDPWAVAGYKGPGGRWPDYDALVRLFPNAFHLAINIWLGQGFDADAGDGERGDMSLPDLAQFLHQAKPINVLKPIGYSSASNVEELIRLYTALGHHRDEIFIWSAHYTGIPHICGPATCGFPQADLTQFTDREFSRNIDGSMVPTHGIFKEKPPVVLPPDPHHYRWFASSTDKTGLPGGPFSLASGEPPIDERATVMRYDHLRPHQVVSGGELGRLKEDLRLLAVRVMNIAYEQERGGVVPWSDFRRFGWRRDQLMLRADGHRLV